MTPVTCGYARVSKSDRDEKNLEMQLYELSQYGLRRDHIFVDYESGTTVKRQGRQKLQERVRSGDTIVVV